MKIDEQRFFEDGYLIIREAVPADQLADLRLTAEILVDRCKARSEANRGPRGPRGGEWYAGVQPRVNVHEVVDEETASVVDFLLGPTVHGVSHQIMGTPESAITSMQITCSGLIDYGHTDWHRDSSAREQAPLSGLQNDLMANRPGYLQWNIALYDDDVFWVVPRSHDRPTDEEQRCQLMLDPTSALQHGTPVELAAGDGIVYPNVIMHWGSYYSSRLRRTLHFGFRSYGGDIFPYTHYPEWDVELGFTACLSETARTHFSRAVELLDRERDDIEAAFGAAIDRDADAFRELIARLHPGPEERMTAVVLLCRIAEKVRLLHTPEVQQMGIEERHRALAGPVRGEYYESLGRRFGAEEASALQQRFAPLDERLAADAARVHERYAAVYAELKPDAESPPNFESRALRQFHSDMPFEFGVDEFVASW